jgi:preprotein translocase subunit SecE
MTTHANKASAKSTPAKKSRFSFFIEVGAELRKAHWPTRQEALRLSILVLVVCIAMAIILYAFDSAFTKLFLLLGG